MSQTILLDLAQEQASKVYSNGDYVTSLSEQTKIEDGDVLNIKNVFIDTSSLVNNKVIIEEDIDVIFNIGKYNQNITTADKTYQNNTAEFKPDGFMYTTCTYTSSGGTSGTPSTLFEYWDSVTVNAELPPPPNQPEFGPIDLLYVYQDMITGEARHKTVHIPNEFGEQSETYSVGKIGIAIGTLQLLNSPSEIKKNGIEIVVPNHSPVDGGQTVINPVSTTATVRVEKGNYDPSALALKITNVLAANNNRKDFDGIINSPMLGTTDALGTDYLLVRGDGAEAYQYTAGLNYYTGASQVELLYDETGSQSFYWNYLHFPFYDSSTYNNISTGYFANGSTPPQNFIASQHSGCFFEALLAKSVATGLPYYFWSAKLCFDVSQKTNKSICPEIKHQENVTIGSFTGSVATVNLEIATNITSGFTGLDSAVKKGDANIYKEPTVPLESTSALTNAIYAGTDLPTLQLAASHFLLEINSNFVNNFINSTTTKATISCIVSKYYGYEGFTSAGSEGSISYQHRGLPVYIQSLRTRFLNPDLTLGTVGNKNHVYVEIFKPPKQVPQIENKK